jgi:hypothetical protein
MAGIYHLTFNIYFYLIEPSAGEIFLTQRAQGESELGISKWSLLVILVINCHSLFLVRFSQSFAELIV